MHFFFMLSDSKDLTVSNDTTDEPPEDGDDDLVLSFEIISEEEIARGGSQYSFSPSYMWPPMPKSSSSSTISTISSKGSSSSLGSTGTCDPPLSVISRHFSKKTVSLPPVQEKPKKRPPELTEEEMMSATARIWYIIQLKGHYNHGLEESDEEDCYYHHTSRKNMMTMENSSTKLTGLFSSLIHLPEKIKQHQADKNRFNVNNISPEAREQLKHLYAY